MARRTLHRTGTAIFVAALTVYVQGVGPLWVAVWAMAVFTTTRHRAFLLFVMAIIARYAIALVGHMGFVIKQDFSRGGLEDEPYGFFRCFLRESRIADNAHQKEDRPKGKCQDLFVL